MYIRIFNNTESVFVMLREKSDDKIVYVVLLQFYKIIIK